MNQTASPFKFLDSYREEEADVFFGREAETEALYEALSGVKHLLVYGPSGAGKTSLVECGLRNQFSDADWFALSIRRGANLTASVFANINEALQEKIDVDPATQLPRDPETGFGDAIENLFAERYQPVYLLFDQFEELLISGQKEEKEDFFQRLDRLIRYKVPCRVLLIMREEFIGHLSEFEPICPSLFQHRFRLEKMTRAKVQQVIYNILEAPYYQSFFQSSQSESLAGAILSKLPDERREIELAHVQVFLGELWDRALESSAPGDQPLLHGGLVKKDDNLEAVLDSFLKKQLADLSAVYGKKAPLELLAGMISERHTKLQLSEADLQKDLRAKEVALKRPLQDLLADLEQRRIVRTLKAGEQTRYEISHDVLALVVGQNLTEEMKLREKAREIYRVYRERQTFFSQDDLDYLRPYQEYLAFPAALEKRMAESEAYLKKEQERELAKVQKRLRTVRGLLAAAVMALLAAGYFGWDANQQRKEAETASNEAQRLLVENRRQTFNSFWAEAQVLQVKGDYAQAIDKYETAKAFTLDTLTVDQAIADCRRADANRSQFNELMQNAEREKKAGNYSAAIAHYRDAVNLKVDPATIRIQLNEFENTLAEQVGKDKKSADSLSDYGSPLADKYKAKVQSLNNYIAQIQILLNNL